MFLATLTLPHARQHGTTAPVTSRSGAWYGHVGPGGTPPVYLPLFWIPCSTLTKRSRVVWETGVPLEVVKRST